MTRGETPRRRPNRKGEGGLLRAEIERAAMELLDELGSPEALTLRGVARAAGITGPAIYPHFAGLPELHARLREISFAHIVEQTNAAAAGITDPRAELITRYWVYVDLGLAYPARRKLVLTPANAVDPNAMAALDTLVEVLDRCVAAGLSHSTDTRLDTALTLAAITGLRVTQGVFPLPPLHTAIEEMVARLAKLTEPVAAGSLGAGRA
ncbi:TetR/AcrR family transcriptional regulator [Lentzea sp. NPDC059081]|uniref:TetR/AcrR family transcriptional regulator n=1 Tax=Lentzea sp. NPDC059081 TaxID=3346719 RepID=UPI0036824591